MKGWQFTLYGGKIYSRRNGQKSWELFLERGLPFSKKSRWNPDYFKSPERITEIQADGDTLCAFDGQGRLFRIYLDRPASMLQDWRNLEWSQNFGWPMKAQLTQNQLVKNKRGWAMGVRREDILYYTDRYKNEHHYGTMGLETIYVLTENGQEIRFTDSGLPTDWSKSILGPEEGAFISRNISCSGSTLFVIGDDGTMYTRLIDFDTMGCDPMFFKYTYIEEKQAYKGSDYRSNFTEWGLPNEDWLRQPKIKLSGKARLSRFIAIYQNGQGNDARELRVAGTDSEGNTGFYKKQLTDSEWEFFPAPLLIMNGDYLTGDGKRGKKIEFSYKGWLLENGKPNENVSISIPDFKLTNEGKANLFITMNKDGWSESIRISLHTVEMWTSLIRYNPGLDGTSKHYFVTAEFGTLEGKHEEFTALLNELFGGRNKKLFDLTAEATDRFVQISFTKKPLDSIMKKDKSLFLTSDGSYAPPLIAKTAAISTEASSYDDRGLLIEEKDYYTRRDIPEIRRILEANKRQRGILRGELKIYEEYKYSSNDSRWGYNFADLLTRVTFLNQIDFPKIKTMTSQGGRIMNTQADSVDTIYKQLSFYYPHLIRILDKRIESYGLLLASLEGGATSVKADGHLKKSYPEYFAAVGLPTEVNGKSGGKPAKIYTLNEVPYFSGLLLEEADGGSYLIVELEDTAKKIFKRELEENKPDALKDSPVKIKANFIPIRNSSDLLDSFAGVTFISAKKGKLLWDGENLTISVKDSIFNSKEIFEAKTK